MKLVSILKSFIIEFLITLTLFSIIYPLGVYLTDIGFRGDNVLMGVITCSLIAMTRLMVKEKNEKTQELTKGNYWKLKNELNRRVNGNQKRKRNSK
jgi:hypothetical protein